VDTFVGFHHNQDHPCRSVLLNPVKVEKPDYIGSWIMSVWDLDPSARTIAAEIWNEIVDLNVEESTRAHGRKLAGVDPSFTQQIASATSKRQLCRSAQPMLKIVLDRVQYRFRKKHHDRVRTYSCLKEAIVKLKISPLRLYVDQDAVDFLKTFFSFLFSAC